MGKREEKKREFDEKILPAPLTAGKSVQCWTPDEKLGLKYSIDRITLIADLSVEIWEKRFFEWLKLPFIEISGSGLQVLDYSNCDVDDFGNSHEYVSPEQVAYIEMPKYQVNKIRMLMLDNQLDISVRTEKSWKETVRSEEHTSELQSR